MIKNKVKKASAWLMCVCCIFGTFYLTGSPSLALTLEEVSKEMDSPLETAGSPYGMIRSSANMEEPEVQIGKTAKWLDIERGYAQIDLTETDTSGYSNQAMDYLIILDRTRTMALNDTVFEGSPSNDILTSNSPCLNRNHYYEYAGQKLDMYDYEHGIIRGTDQVVAIPLTANLYKYHRNADGAAISVDYDNGCIDRLTIAKNTICDLIDQIEANASTAGNIKNRVSYWSFAGTYWPEKDGELDTDLEKGLFNYVKLTSNYADVKAKVQATKAYAGTYYLESLKRAYEQLSARTGSHKDMPAKVIFISDGKCADDEKEVMEWAEKLKAIPNCKVYTLAVGMPVSSDAAVLLKRMSSNQNNTTFAAFTTNLNSSNPAFADTLTAIEAIKTEVKASQKVLTDVLDTRYWDFVEMLSADGNAAVRDNILTWNIPEGAGNTYKCSLKIRLKQEYRFLVSDTDYPTNYDTTEGRGCVMEYTIRGGASHGETRRVEKETPYLKYGTIRVEGRKYFTVDGSEADKVILHLKRKLESEKEQQLSEKDITSEDGWNYSFTERLEGAEVLPLVLYTNEQHRWTYYLEEETAFYNQIKLEEKEENGILTIDIYNEPYKIKAQMIKLDDETGMKVSGAEFGVYMYSRNSDKYVPYCGSADAIAGGGPMILKEVENGVYQTGAWLYYTPDNEGRFRIMEEQAPEGYVGDFEDRDVTKEKHVYDIHITEETTGTMAAEDVSGKPLEVKNTRTKGKIKIYKKDADSHLPIPQGNAVLFYEDEEKNAKYGLFTAENDELVEEKRITSEGFLIFENLELGSYYIKELDTPPEGYLLNPEVYSVTLAYEGEHVPVVIEEMDVLEPVKKQKQKIYKIGDGKEEEEFSWMLDLQYFHYQPLGMM